MRFYMIAILLHASTVAAAAEEEAYGLRSYTISTGLVQTGKCLVTSVRMISGRHHLLVNTEHLLLGQTHDAEECANLCCKTPECHSALLERGICHGLHCEESECKGLVDSAISTSSSKLYARLISMKKYNKTVEENQLEEVQKVHIKEETSQNQKRGIIPIPSVAASDSSLMKILPNHSSCERVLTHSMNKVFKEKMFLIKSVPISPPEDSYNRCMRECCNAPQCKAAFLSNSTLCLLFRCRDEITCDVNPVSCEGPCDSLLMVFEEKSSKRFRIPFHRDDQYLSLVLNATQFPYYEDLSKSNTVAFFLTSVAVEEAITSALERVQIFRGVQTLGFNGNWPQDRTRINVRVYYKPTDDRFQLLRSILDMVRKEQLVFTERAEGILPLNQKGFFISQVGFSLREANGTSLICPHETCLGISWPVVLSNAHAHIACPRKAQGLAERYCAAGAVNPEWKSPSFRHCSQKNYRQLLASVDDMDGSSLRVIVDKLLKYISMDMDLEDNFGQTRDRRISKRSLKENPVDFLEEPTKSKSQNMPLPQIFGDMGDIPHKPPSSDDTLMAIMEPQMSDSNIGDIGTKFHVYGTSDQGNSSVAQMYVGPLIKESLKIHKIKEEPIFAPKPNMILHQMKQIRLRDGQVHPYAKLKDQSNIWRHGMFGADIISSVEIILRLMRKNHQDKHQHSSAEIKELLTVSSLLLDSLNGNEWKIINEDSETNRVFPKLLWCLYELISAIIEEETYTNMVFFHTHSLKIKTGTTDVYPYSRNFPDVYKLDADISFTLNQSHHQGLDQALSFSKRWAVVDLLTLSALFMPLNVFSPENSNFWNSHKMYSKAIVFRRELEPSVENITITVQSQIQPRSCFIVETSTEYKAGFIKELCVITVVSEYTINCTCNSSGFIAFGYHSSPVDLQKNIVSQQINVPYWCWLAAILLMLLIFIILLSMIMCMCQKRKKPPSTSDEGRRRTPESSEFQPMRDGNVYVDLFKNVNMNHNRNGINQNEFKDPSFSSTSNLLGHFSERSSMTNVKLHSDAEAMTPTLLQRRESSLSAHNVQWDSFYSERTAKGATKPSTQYPREKRKSTAFKRLSSYQGDTRQEQRTVTMTSNQIYPPV